MVMRREQYQVPQVEFVFREYGEFVTRTSAELFGGKRVVIFSLPKVCSCSKIATRKSLHHDFCDTEQNITEQNKAEQNLARPLRAKVNPHEVFKNLSPSNCTSHWTSKWMPNWMSNWTSIRKSD